MTHYFLDSSALLKRYVPETGTGWIRNTLSDPGNTLSIAQITPWKLSRLSHAVSAKEA